MQETRLYRKSVTHFIVSNTVSLLYCIAKIGVGAYLLYPQTGCEYTTFNKYINDDQLHFWIFYMCIHSVFMIIIHFNLVKYISNPGKRFQLAQKLDQVVEHQENFQAEFIEDSKRISILTRQIKYEVQKSNWCGKWTSRLFGAIYQMFFIVGVVIFWKEGINTTECHYLQSYYMLTILILCLYQYIDLYIISMFAIIFSPCLVFFAVYYCAQHCAKEQLREEVRQRLQPIEYNPKCIEGDAECAICRCAYELNEKILILQCSKFHHYHETCIMSWLNVNSTCPLCRKPV